MALGSCGSLALCLGTFLNFVHLFGMYKDHLEKLVKNALDLTERKERDFDLSPVNMQFTNALLWVALTVSDMSKVHYFCDVVPFFCSTQLF